MGSGLGTSSILAASTLRAVAAITGQTLTDQLLSDAVMRLEQLMTTGGGWQDQAGGIYPGAKLILSGPGLHQRLRVQPVAWTPQREAEFEELTDPLLHRDPADRAEPAADGGRQLSGSRDRDGGSAAQHQDAGNRDGLRDAGRRMGAPRTTARSSLGTQPGA